ncbi:MAG: MFS transporter [Gammaproteobacteria bacterium]
MNASRKLTISGHWPFDVRNSPIFYGWAVWLVSTIGFLMSIPGQTMGIAVFTDILIDVLGLTRTELSIAYLIGTVTSAFFLTRAGRFYDRVGARFVVIVSCFGLAITLLAIAALDNVGRVIASESGVDYTTVTFGLIVLCYFGVRFSGQGVLTNACRNVLLNWFEKRRGFVAGLRGVFVSLGFSISPLVIAWMIAEFDWRTTLYMLAATIGVGFALIALIFLRDSPESCGMRPDGLAGDDEQDELSRPRISGKTLAHARSTSRFWTYALALGLYGLFITAITFHIAAIFTEAGRTSTEAFRYFLPQAIFSTVVNLISSWLADTRPLKPFLLLLLAGLIVGTFGTICLAETYGYWMMVIGFGTGGGLWGLLSNLAFIRHFGRAHLGEISGFNIAIAVFASAIGPLLFSVGFDYFGTFAAALWLCIVLTAALFVVALFSALKEPEQRMDFSSS